MTLTRRELLRNSALTGATIAAGSAFSGLALGGVAAGGPTGYGALVPDPAGILDLPKGFAYRILATGGNGYLDTFTTYDDGQKLAGDADGAASFAIGGNRIVLVTNHELGIGEEDEAVPQTFRGKPVPTYDPGLPGGTSNIVLDRRNKVVSIYPSLAGTYDNCGGGPTPWGTWLTCEEDVRYGPTGIPHGYVFEVDPEGHKTNAVPYTAMGRCNHEAVAIDPDTSYAYLTEDDSDGLLYRFIPADTSMKFGSLGNGGTLTAMKAEGLSRLGEIKTIGTTVAISWVDGPADPDAEDLNTLFGDVTRSQKLEGIWYDDGIVYFASSYEEAAGLEHVGQIWALDPEASTITLVAYIPITEPTFDSPDNITVAPWGQLILCEDGDGEQYLIGLEPSTGELWAFARNAMGESEFAGANFAPDGKTLFVSIQNPSTTFAITGPWGAEQHHSPGHGDHRGGKDKGGHGGGGGKGGGTNKTIGRR